MDEGSNAWPILLIGVVVVLGFAALAWYRWRRTGPGLPREVTFFVDLIALVVTVFFVGMIAATQLPPPPAPTPTPTPTQIPLLAVVTATAWPTATPSPTATLSPTSTIPPTVSASPTPTATVHVVQEGETLASIAERYNVTVEAIRQANGLTSDLLRVGQELTIPLPTPTPASSGAPTETPGATPVPTVTATPAIIIHVVQQGEVLSVIARRYGVTVEEILAVNPGLNPNRLSVGQEIRIPTR